MVIKYKNKQFAPKVDNKILIANLDEIFYRNESDNYSEKTDIVFLNYEYIKYTSNDFCVYLDKNRITYLSVELDTLDLEWDKNDFHTNILETDNNNGVLEFI